MGLWSRFKGNYWDDELVSIDSANQAHFRVRWLKRWFGPAVAHWQRNWQYWLNWGLAALTCFAAVATLWLQLGKDCDCDGKKQQREKHPAPASRSKTDKPASALKPSKPAL
ncbi:hypothetical protein A7A76_07695 [Lysobacter enzymogenes]|uniref:hypothetical protein n=1 Tax=Lysobacter enzymogenes TaxID=69 RepID=UPI0019D1EE23|nr:hypothetical protein [Lysobacter enzymogenes]MBN7138976.1 hypothetical protein [Lysobacter enzymogenes]